MEFNRKSKRWNSESFESHAEVLTNLKRKTGIVAPPPLQHQTNQLLLTELIKANVYRISHGNEHWRCIKEVKVVRSISDSRGSCLNNTFRYGHNYEYHPARNCIRNNEGMGCNKLCQLWREVGRAPGSPRCCLQVCIPYPRLDHRFYFTNRKLYVIIFSHYTSNIVIFGF